MRFSKFLCIVLAIVLLTPTAFAVEEPEITAAAAILCDPQSGTVLYERNADVRRSPASLTKIMTALIVLEEANLFDVATVSDTALSSLHPDSSVAGLLRGEELSVENLLKCLLVPSANDAANVLAEHLYGSVDAFVTRMNERGQEMGLTNTQFKNTHGLTEEGHYTSARDAYTITVEAMTHSLFMDICNSAQVTIPRTNKRDEQVYYTTNHLISSLKTPDYRYHYARGIKTGHTTDAGLCLASSAEKNGLVLVSVVLGSETVEKRQMSFVDTKTLFEWGFSSFKVQTLLEKTRAMSEVDVMLSSESDYVTLVPKETVSALLPIGFDRDEVEYAISIDYPDGVEAPVARGIPMGEVKVSWRGTEYATVELVTLNSVSLDKTLLYARDFAEFISRPWVWFIIFGIIALILLYAVYVIHINRKRALERKRSVYRGSQKKRR